MDSRAEIYQHEDLKYEMFISEARLRVNEGWKPVKGEPGMIHYREMQWNRVPVATYKFMQALLEGREK